MTTGLPAQETDYVISFKVVPTLENCFLQVRPSLSEVSGMTANSTVENSHCSIFRLFLSLLNLFNFPLHLSQLSTPENNRG